MFAFIIKFLYLHDCSDFSYFGAIRLNVDEKKAFVEALKKSFFNKHECWSLHDELF